MTYMPGAVPSTNGQVPAYDSVNAQITALQQQLKTLDDQIAGYQKQVKQNSVDLKTAITATVNSFNNDVSTTSGQYNSKYEDSMITGTLVPQYAGQVSTALNNTYSANQNLGNSIDNLTSQVQNIQGQIGSLQAQAAYNPVTPPTPTPTPALPSDPSLTPSPTPSPTPFPSVTPPPSDTPTPTPSGAGNGNGSVYPASNSAVPSSGSGLGSGLGGMNPFGNGMGGMNPYGQSPYGQGVYPPTQPAAAAAAPSATPAAQPATASTSPGKPGAGTGKGTEDKAVSDGSANGQHKDGTNTQTANKQPGADGMIVYTFKDGKTQKVPPIVGQALTKAEADNDHTDAQGNYADTAAKWQKEKDPGVRVDPSKLVTGDVAKWDHWTAIVRALPENSGVGVTGAPPDVIVDGKLVAFTGDDMQGKAGSSGLFAGFFHPPAIGVAHQDATADPAPGGAVPVAPGDPGDHHPAVSAPSPAVISG